MMKLKINAKDIKVYIIYINKQDSQVGKTLSKCTKVKDKQLVNLAKELIVIWKKVIHNNTEKKEVKTEEKKNNENINKSTNKPNDVSNNISNAITQLEDKSHESYRNGLKKYMFTAFIKNIPKGFNENDIISKIKDIENKLYAKLPKNLYVQKGKAIASNISDINNEEFRINILKGIITGDQLITMNASDMVNKDIKKEIKTISDNTLESLRSDWDDKHAPDFEGEYQCENCGGRRCKSNQIQMRSADEPMTLFIKCIDCGYSWRIG